MRAAWADLSRPALNASALRSLLVGPGLALAGLDVVAETASTNADLAAAARSQACPADRTLLVCEHQLGGRGRLGRRWQSPARSSLTMSLLLRPPAQTQPGWPWLTLICGLATVQVLRRHAGVEAALKWPNDVLVPPASEPGRPAGPPSAKVAGILGEVVQVPGGDAAVVLGLGLNVSITTSEFGALAGVEESDPAGTAPAPATSLALAGAATTDRAVLLRAIVRRWIELDDRWRAHHGDATAAGLADEVREHCLTLGRQVRVLLPAADPLEGTAEGLDRDGRLLVRTHRDLVPVAAGDVHHVRFPK